MLLGLQLFHFKMGKSTPGSMSISANQIRELVVPSPCETEPYSKGCYHLVGVFHLIIKITISSIVIGLKSSYFSLIHLPSCYRTVCYQTVCYWTVCYWTVVIGQFNTPIIFKAVNQSTNHIQSCSYVYKRACARARFYVFCRLIASRMFTSPLSVF